MTQEPTQAGSPGWIVGESMATELDVALSGIGSGFPVPAGASEFQVLYDSVPEDWLDEWQTFVGQPGTVSMLGFLSGITETKTEADYGRATLAMRELTTESALAKLSQQVSRFNLAPDPGLAAPEALADLSARATLAMQASIGLDVESGAARAQRHRQEVLRITRLLRDGPLHSRFWHWLDRFFYEIYQPWRRTREPIIKTLESHALAMLGALEAAGQPPALAWLPAQNPLRVLQGLRDTVEGGDLQVFFWIEPFGLIDLWDLEPGRVLVSFSQPGAVYHNFHAFAEDVAGRTKAMADPTRLIILRLIRHFGMMNTELASFMEISRPTVSVHAKILREAGLIQSEQHGREVRHEIVPSEVRRLFSDLERFLDLPEDET